VSLAPLVEEARARIIDGLTVAEHEADGKAIPDHIVVKLLSERLAKPDCAEKGWLIEGVPTTRGQAQQLVAAGHVPDKVVHVSCPDDTIIKAVTVPESQTQAEDLLTRKKELAGVLPGYRWECAKAMEALSNVSRAYEVTDPGSVEKAIPEIMAFLAAKPGDEGLRNITGTQ